MDHQTGSGDPDQIREFDLQLDNDVDDICSRCRDITWVKGIEYWQEQTIEFKTLLSTCRICRLLSRCTPQGLEPGPSCIARQFGPEGPMEDHGLKYIIRLNKATTHEPEYHEDWAILVSSLSLEQAEMAVHPLMSPMVSLPRIKKLICECAAKHGQTCSAHESLQLLHLRVIDCDTRTVVDAPANCDFVALSYVWGGATATEDFESIQKPPLTIEHSIHVTLELGFKYLWVDRYCINQQDQQHKDEQISQMTNIYSAAQLTIIAAAGSDPTSGLPGLNLYSRPSPFAYHEKVGPLCFSALPLEIYNKRHSLWSVSQSAWASRAWTYQEAIFSTRRLIFSKWSTIFSCNDSTCLESGAVMSTHELDRYGLPWHNLGSLRESRDMRLILNTIERYCQRKLSHDSDALNAIVSTLGILSQQDHYHVWGVPFRFPVHSWDDDHTSPRRTPRTSHHPSPDPSNLESTKIYLCWDLLDDGICHRRPNFPSWSPLGWSTAYMSYSHAAFTGVVAFLTPTGRKEMSEYLQLARTDPTRMPQLLDLTLRTAVVPISRPNDESTRHLYIRGRQIVLSLGRNFVNEGSVYWNDKAAESDDCVKAAIIAESDNYISLLLLKAHAGHYERAGLVYWAKGVSKEGHEGLGLWSQGGRDPPPDYEWWHDLLSYFGEERIILG